MVDLPNTFKGAPYRRSKACNFDPICVEVAIAAGEIAVRDSKHPDKPPHVFNHEEWRAFIKGVKAGEFDV